MYVHILFGCMFIFCLHDLLHRTITRNGKSELVKQHWFSPRLLSLLDYFIHKSPYWSVHNYEQRLDEDIRESFMRHCMKVHKDGRQDLTGESRAFQRPNYMSTLPFMITDSDAVSAEIWMSRVGAENAPKKDRGSNGPSQGKAASQAAIARMMGDGRPRPSAGDAVNGEVAGAAAASGSPPRPPRAAPLAAASPQASQQSHRADSDKSPDRRRDAAAAAVASPKASQRGNSVEKSPGKPREGQSPAKKTSSQA